MKHIVSLVTLVTPGADAPSIVTTSPNLNLTAVVIILLVTLALVVGDVLGRKSVTMLDVLVIAPFFLVVGACTPIGQGIGNVLGTIHVG